MRIKIGNEKIETSAENTILFNFAGNLAMFNFVYIDGDENYARVFETSANNKLYKDLAKEALEGSYPTHQNMQMVMDEDRQAYIDLAVNDVRKMPNHVPTEWQKAH